MRLWRRASGALKDQNSLWMANLARRTALRNPEMETAVIKATNHDEFSIDTRNIDRVFKWIRISPAHLKPLLWAISMRMEKTSSWVVALKGLMLMHGIFACKIPAIQRIGRLPFDLSNFKDGHSKSVKAWAHSTFIRSYYAFLDQKSTLLYLNVIDRRNSRKDSKEIYSLLQELLVIQKLQGLLDLLLQIKPHSKAAVVPLIIEAMDCVVIEIFDVYSRICSGIARALLRIYSAGKVEATMALRIVQKATVQGEELSLYFEICRTIGVMNAAECPQIEQIPEEDILELEHIINGVSDKSTNEDNGVVQNQANDQSKAIVVSDQQQSMGERKDSRNDMTTIITHDWETFDEDHLKATTIETNYQPIGKISRKTNPFLDSLTPSPVHVIYGKNDDLPDLISF